MTTLDIGCIQMVYNWKTQKQSASIMLIIIMARGYKCTEQTPIMKENSAQQQKNGEHDLRILIVAWAPPSSANIAQNSSNRTQILSFHIFFSHIFQHFLLFSPYFPTFFSIPSFFLPISWTFLSIFSRQIHPTWRERQPASWRQQGDNKQLVRFPDPLADRLTLV